MSEMMLIGLIFFTCFSIVSVETEIDIFRKNEYNIKLNLYTNK